MKNRSRKIVIAGVMSGISIFLGATHLGFIPWFSGASLTIMHLPVIIGAVLEGPVVGTVIGLIFGGFSLLQSAIAPTGPTDVWFVNPIISVLPRLFIGPVAWLVYKSLKPLRKAVGLVASGIAGSLTNTVLVLLVLVLYGYLPLNIAKTVAVVNGLPEAAVAAILNYIVVAVYMGIQTKRKGSRI